MSNHMTVKRCKEMIVMLEARLKHSPTTGVRLAHAEVNSVLDTLQRVVDEAEGGTLDDDTDEAAVRLNRHVLGLDAD
jgi:hypothetical protein